VAATVLEAISGDSDKFRWTVAWGGDELVAGRNKMTDEEWVELGTMTGDQAAYNERFEELFDLSLEL